MNELGSGRPEEIFVGIVALVLAVLVALRVRDARRTGVIPLWRKRMSREEMGKTRFTTLLLVNLGVLVLLLVAGFDMLLGLELLG